MQWERARKWELAAGAFEFTRAEGALELPGFNSLSDFFRCASASAGTFELFLWTAPIYFRPLDEDNFTTTAAAEKYLMKLNLKPAPGLQITSQAAKVYGARIDPDQALGTLLFWQLKNTDATVAASITGDIYVVPNHSGTLSMPKISRTVGAEVGGYGGGAGHSAAKDR